MDVGLWHGKDGRMGVQNIGNFVQLQPMFQCWLHEKWNEAPIINFGRIQNLRLLMWTEYNH